MAIAVGPPPHENPHVRPLTYDDVQQFPDDGYRREPVHVTVRPSDLVA